MESARKQKLLEFLNNKCFALGPLNDKSLILYENALTHSSFANEKRTKGIECDDNERLEFFGNFVLGMLVSEHLFKNFDLSEGQMTKRMVVVSDAKLAEVIKRKKVGLNKQTIRLGKPQLGRNKTLEDSIIASTFEALVGAIYLDKGIRRVRKVVLNIFSNELNKTDLDKNYIGLLQELVQKNKLGILSYVQKRLTGPDHKPTYKAVVKINGKIYGQGIGNSKKAAKMKAAKCALKKLRKD